LRIFAAAQLLGLSEVADAARGRLRRLLGSKSLRPALAAALAWRDDELLRACYWVLLEMLCRPPPSFGPKKFGISADHFEYQQRRWPLCALAPAVEAAAQRRAAAKAAPVLDGFAVCRLHRVGFEARLLRETASGPPLELMQAALCGSSAVLYTADEGASAAPSGGLSRMYCEGCCGVLEVTRLGQRFELHEGVELLPDRDSGLVHSIREQFPHPQRKRVAVVYWDMALLAAGRGQSRWRLNLEADDLPVLSGHAAEGSGGGLELTPPGGERETPWLIMAPAEGGVPGRPQEGRALCWRHPIGTALAFTAALAAVYPWDPGGSAGT